MTRYILTATAVLLLSVQSAVAETNRSERHADVAGRFLTHETVVKSGTPDVARLLFGDTEKAAAFKKAYAQAKRPEMDAYADSPRGRFRVHYDLSGRDAPDLTDSDNNNVPDYIDSVLVYLETAWQILVVDLAYGAPMPDGTRGGSRDIVDCYIVELSPQRMYGVTYPDDSGGSSTSYMTVDNDFSESIYPTKGLDALKITTVHEFFHIIHYTYYGGYDSVWWMEQTAVWSEDYAWDEVDDYLNYLGFLYSDRDIPIDSSTGSFMYGASLFAFHIADKYGSGMLRSVWSEMRDNQNGRIENMNAVLPRGLGQAISDLGVWMYFTGYRANSRDFLHEADVIKNLVVPDHETSARTTVDSLSFRHYTFKYVDILPDEGFAYGDSLYFEFANRGNGVWKNQVILYSNPDNYEIVPVSGERDVVFIPRPFERAVLVIANVSSANASYRTVYTIDIVSSKGVEKEPAPVSFALEQNYPNPFNSATTIPFTIAGESHVTLKIINLQGATVATLVDDRLPPGHFEIPCLMDGVSSGLYYAVLESRGMRAVRKMMFLK